MSQFFILSIFSLFIIFGIANSAYAQMQDESKNDNRNLQIQNIQCKEERVLVVNAAGNAALCIKESSVERFSKLGWTLITREAPTEVTVKILNLFERPSSPGTYTVIFKACTDNQPLRTPQVIASSDSEIRIFNMIKNIDSYSCYNSATLIKSNNPETIAIKINNQGSSNQKILELEQKISKLKSDLEKQNFLLTKLINESVSSDKVLINLQIDEATYEIQRLRGELADVRAEYYNLLYSKYSK